MFSLFLDTAKLFVKGRLFRDNGAVLRIWLLGFVITLVVVATLTLFVNLWLGAVVGGLVSGALMPFLFRDLKYN